MVSPYLTSDLFVFSLLLLFSFPLLAFDRFRAWAARLLVVVAFDLWIISKFYGSLREIVEIEGIRGM